jgi:haloacetate dehalogenase
VILEGFEARDVDAGGEATIHVRVAGSGPPLLLLHGYPQTGAMWDQVAPALTAQRTVVVADLTGYGASSKPATTEDHEPYSKRAMARHQVAAMRALGFERFEVVGHDRGARAAYRMALDHPEVVTRLAVLDVIPTVEMYDRLDMRSGLGAWHWFFLPQPHDLPERLLAADPEGFYFRGREELFAPEALAEYQAALRDPAVIHTICEDYRAGATYDYDLDASQRGTARITCPVLAMWGARGFVAKVDPLAIWRGWADDVVGVEAPCGHHIPEEAPEETLAALREFLQLA